MKLYIVKILLAGILVLLASKMSGQEFRSIYFLEEASLRHRMNPAFMGGRNYVSIPVLGSMNIEAQGNVGLSNFIYKYDDPEYDRTTFLNSSVDRDKFLNKLHKNNKINVNLYLAVLSGGFQKWGGFNTLELGIKSNTSLNLPYELFDLMKTGMSSKESNEYHIKDLAVRSNSYVELALGHARPINEKLTVGGKFKFLFGAANLDAKFDDMYVKMDEDKWEVSAYGKLEASVKGGSFEAKEPDENMRNKIDGFDLKSPGIGGLGIGIDLGGVYKLREDLTLSAAILDLGFISWNKSLKGYNDGIPYQFNGFEDLEIDADKDDPDYKSLGDQFDDIIDDLEDMIGFYEQKKSGGRTTKLVTTFNLGAEYTFPYYERLSFGLLSSTKLNGLYTWTEARLSANINPIEWFEASLSCGVSNLGSSLGWALNFYPKGINIFTGVDYIVTKINSQCIPVNKFNMQANLGVSVTF